MAAKTAKKTATANKSSKPAKKSASTAHRHAPIPLDAKIKVVNKENPFREGTGRHERAKAVLSASGKTVEYAVKHGARRGTVLWLVSHKHVKAA